jgi:hypothetical protein
MEPELHSGLFKFDPYQGRDSPKLTILDFEATPTLTHSKYPLQTTKFKTPPYIYAHKKHTMHSATPPPTDIWPLHELE